MKTNYLPHFYFTNTFFAQERRLVFLAGGLEEAKVTDNEIQKAVDAKMKSEGLKDRYKNGELKGENLVKEAENIRDSLIKSKQVEGVEKAKVLYNTLQEFANKLDVNSEFKEDIKEAYDKYEKAVQEAKINYDKQMYDWETEYEGDTIDLINRDDIKRAPKDTKVKEAYDKYKTIKNNIKKLESDYNNQYNRAQGSTTDDYNAKNLLNATITAEKQKLEEAIGNLNEAIESDYSGKTEDTKDFSNKFATALDDNAQAKQLDDFKNTQLNTLNDNFKDKIPANFILKNVKKDAISSMDSRIQKIEKDKSIYIPLFDSLPNKKIANWKDLEDKVNQDKKNAVESFSENGREAFLEDVNNTIQLTDMKDYKKQYEAILEAVPAEQKIENNLTQDSEITNNSDPVFQNIEKRQNTNIDLNTLDNDAEKMDQFYKNGTDICIQLGITPGEKNAGIKGKGLDGIVKIQEAINSMNLKNNGNLINLKADGLAGPNTIAALNIAMETKNKNNFLMAINSNSNSNLNIEKNIANNNYIDNFTNFKI